MVLDVDIGHASLRGPRARNEDFVGAATPTDDSLDTKGIVLAIADGVGGHAKGREAAEHTVRGLLSDYYATPDTWPVERSVDTVLCALNRWLVSHARRTRETAGMATTLSGLVLRGTRWYLTHVGDSRIYLLRGGELRRLTEDHTWAHPELSNVLKRAVGLDEHLVLDHAAGDLELGDRFMLLTDGVWNSLPDSELHRLLLEHEDADQCAAALALHAEKAGANDNCSALVATVRALPSGSLIDRLAQASHLRPPPRLKPGQDIDGLRVDALLHESRHTLLYRVFDPQTQQMRVLKTLRPEADEHEAMAALVHEEWLARRVSSAHFPQVVSHPERSHLYYLMSWHEGASLRARLDQGVRYTPEQIARLGMDILRALAPLHRLGIVHRDIKPDNIHLDNQGHMRLLDLGVAASDGVQFAEINNPGTPSYMAPELFAGERASESSDLYATGVTLYQLLTRKYPYGEIEPFQRPKFGEAVPPTRYRPDTPAWLEAILLKACERTPDKRFETAEEFLLALERGAHRPLALPRRRPLAQRKPELLLRALLGLSFALNLILLFVLSRH